MIQYEDKYRRSSEKFSIKPLLNAYLFKFIKIREQLKLFNLNDLLIQPMDCEEGFPTENKTSKTIGNIGFWKIWWI